MHKCALMAVIMTCTKGRLHVALLVQPVIYVMLCAGRGRGRGCGGAGGGGRGRRGRRYDEDDASKGGMTLEEYEAMRKAKVAAVMAGNSTSTAGKIFATTCNGKIEEGCCLLRMKALEPLVA